MVEDDYTFLLVELVKVRYEMEFGMIDELPIIYVAG